MIQSHSSKYVARERLRALMDAAVDAIVLIDTQGLIQDCNRAALSMFGYAEGQLLGHNVSTLMPQPFRQDHDGYILRYLRTGEAQIIGIGREVEALRSDGSRFPMHLTVGEILHGDEIIGFAGFIRDLTERKAVEEQLREREAELEDQRERLIHAGRLGTMGEMAAGIAHELNQPLAAIANYANACRRLAENSDVSRDQLINTLGKISAQAERAGEVISGLRRITRKQSLAKQTVELRELVEDLEPLLQMELRGPGVDIEMALGECEARVSADPVQIQQVVLNLVRNAIDAMRQQADRRIIIRLEQRGANWWLLDVEDNGPGVDAKILPDLFHPFATDKADGIGLGLSICRTIVEAHGGELQCVSSAAGQTIFRAILPAIQ